MPLLLRFKISGHSMMPTLKPGQEILISSLPFLFRKPKLKDIISFKEGGKFVVKRISKIKDSRFLVEGDNVRDSKKYGWIDRSRIIGKVIYILS